MHPNAQIIHKAAEHLRAGNIPGLLELFADDLVVHVPPGLPLSGEYRGSQQYMEQFVGKLLGLAETFQLEPHDILASDDHTVGLYTIRVERDGTVYEWPHANVYHIADGKITEFWWTPFDQQKVAAFLA